MSKKKLTPWFPDDVRPVRIGLYQRDYGGYDLSPDFWDGRRWQLCGIDGEPFAMSRKPLPWRGLAEKP
jgi:hypothetical protein